MAPNHEPLFIYRIGRPFTLSQFIFDDIDINKYTFLILVSFLSFSRLGKWKPSASERINFSLSKTGKNGYFKMRLKAFFAMRK